MTWITLILLGTVGFIVFRIIRKRRRAKHQDDAMYLETFGKEYDDERKN